MLNSFARGCLCLLIATFMTLSPTTSPYAQSLLDSLKDAAGNALGAGAGGDVGLTDAQVTDGLMEALKVGTERVVNQIGVVDGYNADAEIHIPLPDTLQTVRTALRSIGQASLANDLELKLNRAAETAAPEAKALFWDTISNMSFDDVRGIYNGSDDAATRYFQQNMTPRLIKRMTPIIDKTLSEVGAFAAYERMMGQYGSIPFVPDVKADLTAYGVEKAMDGLFHYVAIEEAAIRNDPAARTTDLLKKVFSQ